MKNYDLEPAWYYTASGLAWDAALKKMNVDLDLLSDPDMLMVEKSICGGIATIPYRYSKANSPHMGEKYNENEIIKYITYLNANNLYPWAMSTLLPTCAFKWMNKDENGILSSIRENYALNIIVIH